MKSYFCFIDYAKAFDCVDYKDLWKILKEVGVPDYFICLWETRMQVKKQHLELDMNQWTDSKLRGEFIKVAYLTYVQSTSCEMLDWMKHKLESRLLGEISITSDMQMTPTLMAESEEELKSLLMKVKEESETASLKLNI